MHVHAADESEIVSGALTFWSRCGRQDEVAKGDSRAATYSELALRASLTRNEPDHVDYLGKAPRGERAQPGINVKVYLV